MLFIWVGTQRRKNLSSRVALLPWKCFCVEKKILSGFSGRPFRLVENFPDGSKTVWIFPDILKTFLTISNFKGAHSCAALRGRVGANGCWSHFFKNRTTQSRVVCILTETKCEQTPKFACFSVWRQSLYLSHAEMLPSLAVLKEGIKWRRPPPNRKWRRP